MKKVPAASRTWLVAFVNAYAHVPRRAAGQDPPLPASLPGGPGLATAIELDSAVDVADGLWPIFAADNPAEQQARLNLLLDAARLSPVLGTQAQLGWQSRHTDPVELLRASCAVALLQAVLELGWSRLGICAASDCVDAFIDTQRRRARRYCSPTCLNRTRVRTHRHRHRQA
jgi:hypothetical protein